MARLGISEEMLARHIGWDIGAADLTRALARRLGAAAVLNHCSRLVIDPNRRPGNPTSVPAVSDGCVIPGNQDLTPDAVRERVRRYFLPYHRTVARQIAAFSRARTVPAVISVHSFTPRMNGEDRPWHVGVLWRQRPPACRTRCWRPCAPAATWSSATTSPIRAWASSASRSSSTPSARACRT